MQIEFQNSQLCDLSESEIDYISGGYWVGVAAYIAALNAAEAFGEKVGKALYQATH